MTKGGLSVLMSVYYAELPKHLENALKSALVFQTRLPEQLVLVVDGQIGDELEAIVKSFLASHGHILDVLRLEENVGLGRALRHGLLLCTHEYVARMDSDDICYPERFEKQLSILLERPELSILGTSIQEFDEIPGDLDRFRKLPTDFDALVEFARFRNPLNHPSVAFRKSHIVSVGSYQDMPLFEDYYLWARIIKNGYKIANLEAPLLHFRVGNDMIGRRHGMAYCLKEYRFLRALKKIDFLNTWDFMISVATKLPLRLLPKRLLGLLYRKFLR